MKKRTVHANRKKGETAHDMQTVLDAVRGEGEWAKDGDKSITTSFGNLTAIGKRLGVHRDTVSNYVQRWKTVADAIEQEKELRKDFVEDKMLKRVMEGSDTMIIFFAKTQMKDRGYVERNEFTGKDGGPLQAETKINHAIDGDTAQSIFDILASVGALPAQSNDAKDDGVHTAQPDA